MSEKKEKKTAEKTEADIQAGIAALAEAILALDEPAEIAEVPEEEHPRYGGGRGSQGHEKLSEAGSDDDV